MAPSIAQPPGKSGAGSGAVIRWNAAVLGSVRADRKELGASNAQEKIMPAVKQHLYRIRDVQTILGCSRSFVVQLIESGSLTRINLTPTTIRIPAEDVQRYLDLLGVDSDIEQG
jgi:excisionase family DNA binding protein